MRRAGLCGSPKSVNVVRNYVSNDSKLTGEFLVRVRSGVDCEVRFIVASWKDVDHATHIHIDIFRIHKLHKGIIKMLFSIK